MQVHTGQDMGECIRIFQNSIKKRPVKLRIFPFQCSEPSFSGDHASISASFQIGEPYGMLRMQCERRDGTTIVDFVTDGNIRGKITANSMAKNVASKLGEIT